MKTRWTRWLFHVAAAALVAVALNAKPVRAESCFTVPSSSGTDVRQVVQAMITADYVTYLHRLPEPEGLSYWTERILSCAMTPAQVSDAIAHSREHFEGFVKNAYNYYLSRQPDEDGFNYWVNELVSRALTEEQVTAGFLNSPEYQNRAPSIASLSFRSVAQFASGVSLQLYGVGFRQDMVVLIGGMPAKWTYHSSEWVSIELRPQDTQTAGAVDVKAVSPSGQASNSATLYVIPYVPI